MGYKAFSFCIPFDIAAIVRRISSGSSDAPVFQYSVSIAGHDFDWTIDMHMFDDVVPVVRYGILLIFLVELIRITREVINW